MHSKPRIGELLSRMVPLTDHDTEEILHEQRTTHRRFGEIALAWGLCQPEHVWSAWCKQVPDAGAAGMVDLDREGIDAQAVALLLPGTARALRAIPIRTDGEEVVVASDVPLGELARHELQSLLKRNVKCVTAAKDQIDAAIDVYYSA